MTEHKIFAPIELTEVELAAVSGGTIVNTTRSNIKSARSIVTAPDVHVLSSSNQVGGVSIATSDPIPGGVDVKLGKNHR